MSLTNNLLRFSLSLKLILVAFIACVLAFAYYATARNQIRAANEARYASLLLTNELQQSSDDLTRMVRTYVVTGDPRYREQFEEILAIRDGTAPRPEDYEIIYWDLVLDERRPTAMGEAAPLLNLMAEAGFTDEEMNRLNVAKRNSDSLVTLERQAIAAVEAGAIPAEQRLQAIRTLNDDRYHRAKADIMRPVAEATRMVLTRTAAAVASAERQALVSLGIFMLAAVVLGITLWRTMRNLNLVFGGSVRQLRAAVQATAHPATPAAALEGNGDRDSIIGKLAEAHQVRVSDEGRRKDTERAVSEAERRLRVIVGALDEGVCVVQDALIRFVNDKLQLILEKPEAELVDHPFIQFVHGDDRAALMERYRKRVDGVPVAADTTFRVCPRPGVLRGMVSRATEFEWAGRPATLYFVNVMGEQKSG
jgi:PAS domain-containing protein